MPKVHHFLIHPKKYILFVSLFLFKSHNIYFKKKTESHKIEPLLNVSLFFKFMYSLFVYYFLLNIVII